MAQRPQSAGSCSLTQAPPRPPNAGQARPGPSPPKLGLHVHAQLLLNAPLRLEPPLLRLLLRLQVAHQLLRLQAAGRGPGRGRGKSEPAHTLDPAKPKAQPTNASPPACTDPGAGPHPHPAGHTEGGGLNRRGCTQGVAPDQLPGVLQPPPTLCHLLMFLGPHAGLVPPSPAHLPRSLTHPHKTRCKLLPQHPP